MVVVGDPLKRWVPDLVLSFPRVFEHGPCGLSRRCKSARSGRGAVFQMVGSNLSGDGEGVFCEGWVVGGRVAQEGMKFDIQLFNSI